MKHVVIAGAGFAGVRLARKLRKQKDIAVTIINPSPEFRYCPALYRAATGYKIGAARLSLEWMLLDAPNTSLMVDEVTGINHTNHTLSLKSGTTITYDYVVFALGSVTTYFNIEGLHDHAVGVKTTEEVIALREHLHQTILKNPDKEHNYVVVGAGPTGVEMAAALGGYLQRIARKHGHKKRHKLAIWLVEGADRVLPANSKKVSRVVRRRLESKGVHILTNTFVQGESVHSLKTSNGIIKTDTVIWTAGTVNNPFFANQKEVFKLDKRGKVLVNEYLEARHNVYVIGDNAATEHSGLAPTAIWHANFVAKDIKRKLSKRTRRKHSDSKPVQVIPVGTHWAIMQYAGISIHGRSISYVRKLADYIGYGDVLGYLRALTIWAHADNEEDVCPVCHKH